MMSTVALVMLVEDCVSCERLDEVIIRHRLRAVTLDGTDADDAEQGEEKGGVA